MKKLLIILPIFAVLMMALVRCVTSPDSHSEEENHTHEALAAINSLMWQQPDNALAVLLDYLDNDVRDGACTVSTNETFDNHYAQLL